MAVAVPSVSKKSTISTANRNGHSDRHALITLQTSAWKAIEKFGFCSSSASRCAPSSGRNDEGNSVTCNQNAAAVAPMIPSTIAPGTRHAISAAVNTSPMTATSVLGVVSIPGCSGASGRFTFTIPAPTSPSSAMNSPDARAGRQPQVARDGGHHRLAQPRQH